MPIQVLGYMYKERERKNTNVSNMNFIYIVDKRITRSLSLFNLI